MKRTQFLLLVTVIASTVLALQSNAVPPVTRRGTMVSHYQTRNDLTPTVIAPAAVGTLRLQSNMQGNSSKETFRLKVSGLSAETGYQLVAIAGEDTNSVPIGEFTTDSRGTATVLYSKNGNGKNKSLPAAIDPLFNVRAIGVTDTNSQTVLVAWINTSTSYQYLVKKNLANSGTNNTAAGSISLKSNSTNTKFKLLAGGLSATNQYHLALNSSNIFEAVSSDANGQLVIDTWPALAPSVLDLRSLSLLDSGSNVVLSTSLPR